jgi:hypothetical protein
MMELKTISEQPKSSLPTKDGLKRISDASNL